MKNNNDSELENLETWDTNQVEVRQPKKPSRVVFSVAFSRDDFNLISKYADFCGMKTSKFISEAAIEKAVGQGELLFRGGSQDASWIISRDKISTTTIASGPHADHTITSESHTDL
jgi:hypothetical protein